MAPKKLEKKLRKEAKEGEDQQSVQQISSPEIKEILKKWTELQIFVQKTHPDREKVNRCIHLLNDNAMSYYRTVLKKKQKQTTLDQFLVPKRLRPSDPEAGPSGLQTLPRKERTPESQLFFCWPSLGVSERIIGISIISYGKNNLDLRPT